MSFTLANARTFLQDYDRLNGSSRAQRVYDKVTNDSLRELYACGEFDFSTRVTRLSFAAPYTTGTVSVTAGGTAVTGVGTTFTAAMVGRFIRFNGEAEQYLISAFGSTTGITIEAYLGTADLAAKTFQITDERKSLPTLCRSIQAMSSTRTGASRADVVYLEPCNFSYMNQMRQNYTTTIDIPSFFATKWENPVSGNVPLGYVYIYPAPSVAQIVTTFYNVWPVAVSASSDECPIPYEAEGVIREFLLAGLFRETSNQAWTTQLAKAKSEALTALGASRTVDAHKTRQEWSPCSISGARSPVLSQTVVDQLDP